MITIDGKGGGGQILRTSVSLSASRGIPFKIINIRGARDPPGLKLQHITAIKAVGKLCNAKISTLEKGVTELTFEPGKIRPGKYSFDIGTAGSTALVAQALLPAALHASGPCEFKITGGTENLWAPNTTYFEEIFSHHLQKMGVSIESETVKYGFYPKGGGVFKFKTKNSNLKPINLTERGLVRKLDLWNIASEQLMNRKVIGRQTTGFKNYFINNKVADPIEISKNNKLYVSAFSPGTSCTAVLECNNTRLGAATIGEKRKPAEQVGADCAHLLIKEILAKAAIDRWSADQLMIYMAIVGNSKVKTSKITNHIKTNAYAIEQFLDIKFKINEKENTVAI